MWRWVDDALTAREIRDWILGDRWLLRFGMAVRRSDAANISGECLSIRAQDSS